MDLLDAPVVDGTRHEQDGREGALLAVPPSVGGPGDGDDRAALVLDLLDAEDRAFLRSPASALPDVVVCLCPREVGLPAWLPVRARELAPGCRVAVVRPPRADDVRGTTTGRPGTSALVLAVHRALLEVAGQVDEPFLELSG